MRVLWEIKKRSFLNKLKLRLKKPLTYVYGAVILAYLALMVWSMGVAFEVWGMNSPTGFVWILSVITLINLPANFRAYAKHKGLIFLPSDVHLLFPAPIRPKYLLLYGLWKNISASWLLCLVITLGGIGWFHLNAFQVAGYLFFALVLETVFEGALVILIYGNERLGKRELCLIGGAIYGVLLAALGLGVYLFFTVDSSLGVVGKFLSHPALQALPVLGWNIAAIRLILLGPDTVNVICAALYGITTLLMAAAAVKMPCDGGYYEDAMTFAEDYQAALQKSKEGKLAVVGKKEKFRRARVTYKGTGAKAIYYRQLLEYKKKRFFIFGGNSLICLGIGIALALVGVFGKIDAGARPVILPAVSAYVILIFSGYSTKWERELKNPYTFLIPDKPFWKMWEATKIEHIRNLIDGCLIALPGCFFLPLTLTETLGGILAYACFKAANLYARMICEGILGKLFGQFGMSLVHMLIFLMIAGIGAFFGVTAGAGFGVTVGYLALIGYCLLLTGALAAAASTLFHRMEMLE